MRVSLGNASTTGDIVWKANGSLEVVKNTTNAKYS